MHFKEKLASWVAAATEAQSEKTAGLFDMMVHGAAADALTSDAGGAVGSFSPRGYLGKLLGAEAIGGVTGKLLSEPLGTYSYSLNKMLHGGVGGALERVKAEDLFTQSLVGSAAQATSETALGALEEVYKGLKKSLVDSPKRQAILAHLRKNDDIIGSADMGAVLEAYSSMSKFAPKLSTNLSAAKSFLREAVQHDGGIDFMTVKGLAQAERAITGQNIGGS